MANTRRLHLITGNDHRCAFCGYTLLDPVFRVGDEAVLDEQPNATRSPAVWAAWQFNCQLVEPPAGKLTPTLTGSGA